MVQDMTLDELKQITIDYYVNLQRIKKADTGNNPELEYQLKVYKNKLASLGIPSEEYEMKQLNNRNHLIKRCKVFIELSRTLHSFYIYRLWRLRYEYLF